MDQISSKEKRKYGVRVRKGRLTHCCVGYRNVGMLVWKRSGRRMGIMFICVDQMGLISESSPCQYYKHCSRRNQFQTKLESACMQCKFGHMERVYVGPHLDFQSFRSLRAQHKTQACRALSTASAPKHNPRRALLVWRLNNVTCKAVSGRDENHSQAQVFIVRQSFGHQAVTQMIAVIAAGGSASGR